MARILISLYANYSTNFFRGLYEELEKNGNDVLAVNWVNIVLPCGINDAHIVSDEYKYLTEKIINFNPDFVINYNFTLPIEILEQLKCKMILANSDIVEFWSNQEYLDDYVKNNDVYFMMLDKNVEKQLKERFHITDKDREILYCPVATYFQNTHIPYKRNISFLGTFGYNLCEPVTAEQFDLLKFLYIKYNENPFFNYDAAVSEYKQNNNLKDLPMKIDILRLKFHFAGLKRQKYLSVLTDLGFEQYGEDIRWCGLLFDMDLASTCQGKRVEGFENVQELYNSSKICINCSNPVAVTSFSFRVMDIMATNACLLTEDKPEWRMLFEPYVSKETLDAVIYKDRYDMREKAKRLLADEDLRQRCVKDLNYAIEMNGRWSERVSRIEKFIKLPLLNLKNENQYCEFIDGYKFNKSEVKTKLNSKKKNKKIKASLKIVLYSLLLIIAQCPIFFIKKGGQNRLINKIEKYYRLKYGIK